MRGGGKLKNPEDVKVISLDEIAESIRRNEEKHPELKEVKFRESKGWEDIEGLSKLIEKVWSNYYKGESRIVFSPEYINYEFGEDLQVISAENEDNLLGVSIGKEIEVIVKGKPSKGFVATGLSVKEDWKKKGIGKAIHFNQQKHKEENNYNFISYWFDLRKTSQGSSAKLFPDTMFNYKIPYYFKVVDLKGAKENENLSGLKAIGAELSYLLNSRGKEKRRTIIQPNRPNDAESVCDIISEYSKDKEVHFVFKPEDLRRKIQYSIENPNEAVHCTFESIEKTVGAAGGFKHQNESKDKGILYLDYLFFNPKEGNPEKGLKEIEQYAKEIGCYGILVPESSTNLSKFSLIRRGYFPLGSQLLGIEPLNEETKDEIKYAGKDVFFPLK